MSEVGEVPFGQDFLNALDADAHSDPTGLRAAGGEIGSKYDAALGEYGTAVSSGNQEKINQAEIKLRDATRRLEAFSKISEMVHEMIMRLIQRLRVGG